MSFGGDVIAQTSPTFLDGDPTLVYTLEVHSQYLGQYYWLSVTGDYLSGIYGENGDEWDGNVNTLPSPANSIEVTGNRSDLDFTMYYWN